MHQHRWLAALFVILALAGCVQVATGPGQASHAPYSRGNGEDTYADCAIFSPPTAGSPKAAQGRRAIRHIARSSSVHNSTISRLTA
jgi:hypothetical protein